MLETEYTQNFGLQFSEVDICLQLCSASYKSAERTSRSRCAPDLLDLQRYQTSLRITQSITFRLLSCFRTISYLWRSAQPDRCEPPGTASPDCHDRCYRPRDMLNATVPPMTSSAIQNIGPSHIPPPPQPIPQSFIMTKLQVRLHKPNPSHRRVQQASSECTQSRRLSGAGKSGIRVSGCNTLDVVVHAMDLNSRAASCCFVPLRRNPRP